MRFVLLTAALAASAMLASCGGSSDSSPPAETADNDSTNGFVRNFENQRESARAIAKPLQARWSAVTTLSIVPAAASALPNGKVVLWAAEQRFGFATNSTSTYTTIFDPATNSATEQLVSNTGHGMFCSGTSNLPDGRLMVTGGSAASATSIFDPVANTWKAAAKLNISRAYNSNTVLGDGSVLTLGGSWNGGIGNKDGEIWTEAGGWRKLTGVPIGAFETKNTVNSWALDSHLWLLPAGNGKVFHAGPGKTMHWISTQGNGAVTDAGLRSDDEFSILGNTVMFDTGKILKVGGAVSNEGAPSNKLSYVIDLNSGVSVRKVNSMAYARAFHNSIVLPTGQVVVLGGQTVAQGFSDSNSVLVPEMFDPVTETFTSLPPMSVPRNYHSVALLLPDGRVLSSGGGLCGTGCAANHGDLQILSPNYLFKPDGTPATRPVINSAPTYAPYGSNITVNTDSAVTSFSLVRVSSTTHTVNNDQRRLALTFSSTGANSYSVDVPSNPGWAVPGVYMLFAMNADGTPSIAKMVTVGNNGVPVLTPPDTQTAVVNTAASLAVTAAPNGGAAVTYSATGLPAGLSINAATGQITGTPTMEGISQVTVTAANGVGKVSSQFAWNIGKAASGGVGPVFGVAAGTVFTDVVAANQNLTGVAGRGGWWLDAIQGLGTPANLAYHGGTGGNAYSGTWPADEYLVRIFGSYGETAVSKISFATNTGRIVGPFGLAQGQTSNVAFDYTVPTGTKVVGFTGRVGGYLSALGLVYAPVQSAPVANRAPTIATPTPPTAYAGLLTSFGVSASDPDDDALTYAATGLPTGMAINTTTGTIAGTPGAAGTYSVKVTATDSKAASASLGFQWTVLNALPVIQPIVAPTVVNGSSASYTVNAGAGSFQYAWDFGDGTAVTAYSSSNSVSHTYANAGVYNVTVMVGAADGPVTVRQFIQAVGTGASVTNNAMSSSNIAIEKRSGASDRLWVANLDTDTVSVFDTANNSRVAEISVGAQPRTLAINAGVVVVANKGGASLSVISPATLAVTRTVALPRASQPYGVLVGSDGSSYVALEATGQVLKFSNTWALTASTPMQGARHLAMSPDGARLLVTRFVTPSQPGEGTAVVQTSLNGAKVGGIVAELSAATLASTRQFVLQYSAKVDSTVQGRGVPNYLGAPAISPDGKTAWVPSKQDNIQRGVLRDGNPLDFQNTVRSISSRLDLTSNVEDYAARVDHDNSGLASAAVYHPNGVYLFVAQQTSREVAVIDAAGKREILRLQAGRAPEGLSVSSDGKRLYVHNFMDRTVGVYDLSRLLQYGETNVPLTASLGTIGVEKLSATVLQGKQFFYDAKDVRLARDSYLSCASCHNDGGHDGRTWDFTGFGEGLRNTISLRGRAGLQGNKHWTGNFDEIQDFEGQIRSFAQGTGLMGNAMFTSGTRSQPLGDKKVGQSVELDALAAYVASLNTFSPSPWRTSTGALTTSAQTGKTVFTAKCASCHSGADFTNSATGLLRNVGTIKASSGKRLGATLTGLDTPTLRDVWATAPYLHDGSAASIEAAISAHTNMTLTAAELASVGAYAAQIGSEELVPTVFGISPVFGSTTQGTAFTDPIAPDQVLTGLVVRGGWWLDSIQGLATPSNLPVRGGNGGQLYSATLAPGEYLVRMYGKAGNNAIAQLRFVSNTGRVFGPYGSAVGQATYTSFDYTVPAGNRILGFSGRSGTYLHAIGVLYGP